MSPNEFQLRAALHDGEGDVPDADRAITNAMRMRYDRRRRITSIASSAAVVAVVLVGGTLLLRAANDSESGGAAGTAEASLPALGAANPGQGPRVGTAGVNSSADTAHRDASAASAAQKAFDVPCPARFPRMALPGGGGTNQFGADGPLFSAPVLAMKVCVYPPGDNGSAELDGTRAQRLASELEAAPTPGPRSDCLTAAPEYAMYSVTSAGTVMRVVTAQPACGVYLVTNGTAARVVALSQFYALHLANAAAPSPNQGSPPR